MRMQEMTLADLSDRVNELSTVREVSVGYVENEELCNAENFKALINNTSGEIESIVTKQYTVVQHRTAFNAIIDGLMDINPTAHIRASVTEDKGRAWMHITYRDMIAQDNADGIELGFTALNSYDRSTSLRYGGKQTNFDEKGHFEFFGLRLACMNGMTHRVNINNWANLEIIDKTKAKVGDIVGIEKDIIHQTEVANTRTVMKHIGDLNVNILKVKQLFRSLPYVAKELETLINGAQAVDLTKTDAENVLIAQGFGPRIIPRIMENYQEPTRWGLSNALTAYASHDERVSPMRADELRVAADRVLMNVANPKKR